MKTTTVALTKEQQAARAAAEAFFGELLAKPKPKTKAETTAKVWRENATKNIIDKSGWTPAFRLTTVTHQHCETCNSDHSYTGASLVSHTNERRGDSLTLAIPMVAEENLPHRIQHDYETTHICATCIAMSTTIDNLMFPPLPVQAQLQLFA